MVIPWLLLVVSAGAIVFAGTKLSRYGDQIAELTGLGRLWIGVVLMGIIYRVERRFRLIEPDSLLMIVVYVLGLWLLFNG